MILTAQPFYNELDLLLVKMETLRGVVDAHVVVEATTTFTGLPKPLYFAENRERFKDFPVVYSCVDLPRDVPSPWVREGVQHREIHNIVKALDPEIVIWGDTDECPRPEIIDRFRGSGHDHMVVDLDWLIFFFDRLDTHDRPTASRIARFDRNADKVPSRCDGCPHILRDAGWHFSYFQFGQRQMLIDKLSATSHAVEDDGYSTWSMRKAVTEGRLPGMERTVPYDLAKLPAFVRDNRERFASAFFQP